MDAKKIDTNTETKVTHQKTEDEIHGEKVRKRNQIISIVFGIIFFAVLIWICRHDNLISTSKIQEDLRNSGIFGPFLFIAISIFTSYFPIIPMGSMGAIGIVLFGQVYAFILNTIVSYINCICAYWLVKKYGLRIILTIASPQTIQKTKDRISKMKHFELFFGICMFLPVSPDILLCMMAAFVGMKFSHFLLIILISRPFSSWCYNNFVLVAFKWLRSILHI